MFTVSECLMFLPSCSFNSDGVAWAVCALASRFITHKPALYSLTMKFARDAAGKALVDGLVSIDVCQAYLLMAVYPRPGKKWDKDRSWLLMGVAIRYVPLYTFPINVSPCSQHRIGAQTRSTPAA